VVGDSPRDLACARALGLRCALVATGHHSVESLTLLGPDLVLPTLTEKSLWRGAWFD
jgi:phosphoglycolate phosphatase